MVASQILFAVCTISVAVAAPQLGSRRTVTTTSREVSSNPDQIVTSVLSALQQPIASAVAEALRGLQTTQTISTTGSRGLGSGRFSATGGASGGRFVSNGAGFSSGSSKFLTAGTSGASRGSSLASNGATVATGGGASQTSSHDIFVRPEYNFEFKVSDDTAQTYISQKEERDGENVSGSYSYIDANGALVTVNYQAGNMGYTETRDVKEGVIQIRPIIYEDEQLTAGQVSSAAQIAAAQNAAATQRAAAQRAAAERAAAAERNTAAQRAAAERAAATQRAAAAQRAAAQRAAAQRAAAERAAAQTSSINSNALISQIIAAIQPQIGTAVQNAIGSTRSTSSITAVAPITSSIQTVPVVGTSSLSSSSGQASGLSSLFGTGGNLVRIATPKFQVEY